MRAAQIVEAVEDAFASSIGVRPGRFAVLAILRDPEVNQELVADLVEQYLKTRIDLDVSFEGCWERFQEILRRVAPRYA